MKKLLYIMFLNVFLLTGCGEDWLVPTNDVNPTLESFYTNEANLVSAVNGVYRQLLNGTGNLYGYRIWAFGDAAADLVDGRNLNYYSANPEAIQRGTQTPGNGFINALWTDNYNIISRANAVLHWADKVPIAADKINQRKGEVSFLRALAYFNIVRIFGGRPDVAEEDKYGAVIMTDFITSTDLEVLMKSRSTVTETYNLILSDLDNAIAYLPKAWGGSDKGRANKYSAFALKAKVLMTMAGTSGNTDLWTKASAACDSVISSNKFALWNTVKNGAMANAYADLFKKDAENGVESLFEVQASNSSTIQFGFGEQYNNVLAPDPALIPFGISTNRGYPTSILVNMYEPNDKRKSASIFVVGDKFYPDGLTTPFKKSDGTDWTYTSSMANASRTGYNCKKYISGAQLINTQENGPANPRVLRYAEVLLIKAEAVNELTGPANAFQYVNMVRTRAGLPNLDAAVVTDKAAMRSAIWKERALELFLEGDRWFDLKRTGRLITQLAALNVAISQPFPNNDARHWMMPIPQGEIDKAVINGTRLIIQNPVYQ